MDLYLPLVSWIMDLYLPLCPGLWIYIYPCVLNYEFVFTPVYWIMDLYLPPGVLDYGFIFTPGVLDYGFIFTPVS